MSEALVVLVVRKSCDVVRKGRQRRTGGHCHKDAIVGCLCLRVHGEPCHLARLRREQCVSQGWFAGAVSLHC